MKKIIPTRKITKAETRIRFNKNSVVVTLRGKVIFKGRSYADCMTFLEAL